MGIMDTVAGGVGTGIQPKDNPNPVSPQPSAAAQTGMNSMPAPQLNPGNPLGAMPVPEPSPGGAPQAPPSSQPDQSQGQSQAPKNDDSSDVDRFINEQAGSLPKGDTKAIQKKKSEMSVDDFLKDMPGMPTNEPEDDKPFLGKIRDFVSQQAQSFKAKFRAGIARTGSEELTGLEKVYGQDNVKVVGNDIFVKPDGSRNFKKFNENETSAWMHAFYQGMFGPMGAPVVENPAGTLAQLPGMLAQGVSSAVGAAGGFLLGNVPGAIAGGAGGGFAGSKISKGIAQGMNEWLGQADPNFHYENKLSSVGDAMQNDYVQGALGAVGGALYGRGAIQAAKASSLAAKGLTQPEIQAVTTAGEQDAALAKWSGALKEFHSTVVPAVETGEAGTAGEQAVGAGKRILNYWGQKIGAIEEDAAALQQSKKSFLPPSEFFKLAQEELPKYGVRFLESGDIDVNRTVLQKSAPASIEKLMDLYTEAKTAVGRSAVSGVSDEQPGLTIQHARQIVGKLGDISGSATEATEKRLFAQARAALDVDRATHLQQLFGGENSTAATTWREAMKEYSMKTKAMGEVMSQFDTPEKQSLIAKSLTRAGSPKALEAANSLRTLLGDDSPYWQNIRSEVVGRLVSKSAENGEFNPKVIAQFLNNGDNKPLLNTLFEGKTGDLNMLKGIMTQGAETLQTAVGPSEKAKAVTKGLMEIGMRHMPGSHFLRPLTALTGGNKVAIDMARETLIEGMSKAVGPAQREAMLSQLNAIDSYTAKSQLVNVPVKSMGRTVIIQKYLPIPQVLQGATQMHGEPPVDQTTQPVPQPTPSPVPNQAPQPIPPTGHGHGHFEGGGRFFSMGRRG